MHKRSGVAQFRQRGATNLFLVVNFFWLVMISSVCEKQPADLISSLVHPLPFFPLCILRLDDPSLPLSVFLSPYPSSLHPHQPPPALHQPTPAIFTPHTSVAALIQPQTAAGSIAKRIIQQQSTSPSPSLPLPLLLSVSLPLSMHSSSRGSSEAEGPY